MLHFYSAKNGSVAVSDLRPESLDNQIFWYDLLEPTRDEELYIEKSLGIDIPTKEEIKDIEGSARLYTEGETVYATAAFPVVNDEGFIDLVDTNFVICKTQIITVRYQLTRVITPYAQKLLRTPAPSAEMLLVTLMEAFVEAIADMQMKKSDKLDALSRSVFSPNQKNTASLSVEYWRDMLRQVGVAGQTITSIRESLVSFARMATFLSAQTQAGFSTEALGRIQSVARDCAQLAEHCSSLNSKVALLQDATLGLLNVEQNQIIKFFSVVTIMLMPPTLIAGIYGMNFEWMPELKEHWGYPITITVMVAAALIPYIYFKIRKWL